MPFSPRNEILPDNQRRLLPELAPVKDLGFALYGGTAIALRLGHRESVDFDFFSDRPLDKRAIEQALPAIARGGAQIVQDEPNTWVMLAEPLPASADKVAGSERVKLSFFGALDIGRVDAPELTSDGVLLVASRRDLLATKLKVLFDRVELKDYLDLAEMLRQGQSLGQGLADAAALWPGFLPHQCLGALAYHESPELRDLDIGRRDFLLDKAIEASKALDRVRFAPAARSSDELGLAGRELAREAAALRRRGREPSAPTPPSSGRSDR